MSAARYQKLILRIRSKIGDTGAPPAFTDLELTGDIDAALAKHNSDLDIDSLPRNQEELVVKLVWMGVCLVLAQDSAKEYNLTLDGMAIDKSKRVNSYLELYKVLEQEYKDDVISMGLMTGSGDIVVGELTRESLDISRKVPYNTDRGLPAPFLQEPVLADGKVALEWSGVFSTDLLCYEVLRDDNVVAAYYDVHTTRHIDTPADGKHTYRIVVKTKNWITSESNAQEITK